jgi:chemotaxis protein MotB
LTGARAAGKIMRTGGAARAVAAGPDQRIDKKRKWPMIRNLVVSAVVVASLAVGGCVSTSKYDQMAAEKDREIAALKEQKAALETASKQSQSQYDSLVKQLSEEVQKGQLQVRQYQNMLSVDVAEQIFFDSGRADLKDSGKEVLAKVGEALKSYDKKLIRVVGHTDNVPLAKSIQKVFPSNWELSVVRATNVVRYLQEVGIPPERMVASGRGEYSPVAPNDTPEGRQKNRRIEIMLMDQSLAEEIGKQEKPEK